MTVIIKYEKVEDKQKYFNDKGKYLITFNGNYYYYYT